MPTTIFELIFTTSVLDTGRERVWEVAIVLRGAGDEALFSWYDIELDGGGKMAGEDMALMCYALQQKATI